MNRTDFMAREGCNERMIGLFVENYCKSEGKQAIVNGKIIYHIKSKKGQNSTILSTLHVSQFKFSDTGITRGLF